MDVDLVDEDLGRTVMLKSGMHATVFSVDEEEADAEMSATKKLSLSNRLTR
jgi:preprotein translocase subunit YajC